MPDETHADRPPTLHDYLGVLRRRVWIALPLAVLVPLALVLATTERDRPYAATAEVLLRKGSQTEGGAPAALRAATTQSALAEVPTVAARALTTARIVDRDLEGFLKASTITPSRDSDMLEFRVTDPDPQHAATLATELARAYTTFTREIDSASVERARAGVKAEIARLSASRRTRTDEALLEELVAKERELRVEQALRPDDAVLVAAAGSATRTGPGVLRTGVVGLGIGCILAILAAFLAEALDRRVRSASELVRLLGLPLLARLPKPPRRLSTGERLIMGGDLDSAHAEAFRVLRTNLHFFNLEHQARTVMVTSAGRGQGKTTTAANLAVALARNGERVILVDLDLRRPAVGPFFMLSRAPGVTDVLTGRSTLDEALTHVPLTEPEYVAGIVSDMGTGDGADGLRVLTAGSAVPNRGELVASLALTRLLHDLCDRADIVLIDGPPLIGAGDGIALCGKVDALLVVARLNDATTPTVEELGRLLDNVGADKLGLVVTGAEVDDDYRSTSTPGGRSSVEMVRS
jgi:polysaccharide biosynthesis transport protein